MRSEDLIIAIDLGSNTLRVLCYDCQAEEAVAAFEKIVKTADGLREHGFINDAAVARVIAAIKEAKQVIDFSEQRIKAVTTEALRQASNKVQVIRSIEEETGIIFEIISGEKEAEYTLLAVKNRLRKLHYASQSFVLVDIGGGSTELIFCYPDKTISKSFPVGIVTIAQTYQTLEKIDQVLSSVMFEMQMFCAEVYATKGKVDSFVATAGTPTTVAAMKLGQTYESYDASKINGTSLVMTELDLYLKKLLAMPLEEREVTVGTGRSDLIAAGILIFKQLFTIVEFEKCVVVDDGLREGVALKGCNK